ncbi:MAG: hypothetical protein LBS60_08935 [Deltaproteobacteria bacterium]|jgi:hypothetical protein|nr:hypothetical protein [Deltaproteobacteria bacterium]
MDAQIFKAGTPVIRYGQGAGDPSLYKPPFGRYGYGETSPPFNAHFNGAAGSVNYPAGCPLKPRELQWQRDNLKFANLAVDDIIQMIVVPCNHWIEMVRFDVNNADPTMAGVTVAMTGQLVQVDPTDPYNKFLPPVELPIFADAATAQGITPIPLHVPSSTVLWLSQIASATVTGDIPAGTDAGGGTLTNGAASGFIQPLYVAPEFHDDNSVPPIPRRHETGALILGIKIVALPTGIKIEDALYDFYLTSRVTGLACPSFK